jgi:hypothetical protein
MKGNRFLSVISYLLIFLLTSQPLLALDTYVVTDDIVFVRPTPEAILPQEQLHGDEAYQQAEPYKNRFFYFGENIQGEEQGSVIKLIPKKRTVPAGEYDSTGVFHSSLEEQMITGYLDKSKLWKEPSLLSASSNHYQTLKDVNVYVIPNIKSKTPISLYQGEVLEVVGRVDYNGLRWIKAKFHTASYLDYNRYGYILESDVQPLIYGQVNESSLTLSEVPTSLRNFNQTITQKDKVRLAKDGFYIDPTYEVYNPDYYHPCDEMADAYNGISSSVFITSDLYLHAFHRIFDNMLQDVEEYKLFPQIRDTSIKLAQQAENDYNTYKGNDLQIKKALIYNVFFFSVAAKLFEPKFNVPAIVRLDVDMVVGKIYKAEQAELPSFSNPIELGDEDFSQYKVRGHYTKKATIKERDFYNNSPVTQPNQSQVNNTSEKQNYFELYWSKAKNAVKKIFGKKETVMQQNNSSQNILPNSAIAAPASTSIQLIDDNSTSLEKYFRGMMWYGRHSLLIKDDTKTLAAILMVGQIQNAGEMQNWQNLDTALTRLMGKTDDWTPIDCRKINEKVFGKSYPTADDIEKAGFSSVDKFKKEAKKSLPLQKIVSMSTGAGHTQQERLEMTSGFKFLGQRFSWDAYFFNQLTSPSVGDDYDPRNMPDSLDVMSLLDSTAAKKEMAKNIQNHTWVATYNTQLNKMKNELGGELQKKETTYNTWMYSLQSLFEPVQSKQFFAIQEPWQYKNLNTALGSWTELKHDTLLYMEQSYSESGGEGDSIPPYAPPSIKGYVEPNPVFFNRLHELVLKLKSDLKNGNLLTDEYANKLETIDNLTIKAAEIAQKEINGSEITKEDYQWMERLAEQFNMRLLLPSDIGNIVPPEDIQIALIADVATDAAAGAALEIAIGKPQRIFVVVKDAYGGTRITTGYVYSWYQFADNKRWNDNEWKAKIYGGDKDIEKYKPSWYSKIQK